MPRDGLKLYKRLADEMPAYDDGAIATAIARGAIVEVFEDDEDDDEDYEKEDDKNDKYHK